MSPPDTDIARQERRHRWPLLGIFLALGFVGVLAFVFLADGGDEVIGAPEDAGNPVMTDDAPATNDQAAGAGGEPADEAGPGDSAGTDAAGGAEEDAPED